MNIATAKQLTADLVDAGLSVQLDWGSSREALDFHVSAVVQQGSSLDAKQIAQLENKYNVTAPITTKIQFV